MLRDDAALKANIFPAGFAKEATIRDRKRLLAEFSNTLVGCNFRSEATGPLHLRFPVGGRLA